jgi:TATA-box binding protein (TBP) (component of TFIID and TFIIIB)
LVYSSGKVVCVGARTPEVAVEEYIKLRSFLKFVLKQESSRLTVMLEKLEKLDDDVGSSVEINNVVASGRFSRPLILSRVQEKLMALTTRKQCFPMYEPERFVALSVAFFDICSNNDCSCDDCMGKTATLMVFPSGKVNVTGVKDIKVAEEAFYRLSQILAKPCCELFPFPVEYICQNKEGPDLVAVERQDFVGEFDGKGGSGDSDDGSPPKEVQTEETATEDKNHSERIGISDQTSPTTSSPKAESRRRRSVSAASINSEISTTLGKKNSTAIC